VEVVEERWREGGRVAEEEEERLLRVVVEEPARK
jgi:hypothetical protein